MDLILRNARIMGRHDATFDIVPYADVEGHVIVNSPVCAWAAASCVWSDSVRIDTPSLPCR